MMTKVSIMGEFLNTSLRLREAALENIRKYCEEHNEMDNYDNYVKELRKQADEFNLKLPVDFYAEFYNRSLKLLNEGKF